MEKTDKRLHTDYASSREAMAVLNVKLQTLYAYVSRGWIQSISQAGLRDKLYLRDDLKRVAMRSHARSGHGAVAASAMNWGEPIFPTSITEISSLGPRYRGHLAADLVRSGASFEAVAELLWGCVLTTSGTAWPVHGPSAELVRLTDALTSLHVRDNVLESFALHVLLQGTRGDAVKNSQPPERMLAAAREIMQTVVACCGFAGAAMKYRPMRKGETLVAGLMQALAIPATTENSDALNAILILLADHELPPGTLSARVVASAGGSLHSCIAAALCATSGTDVGRMYERVEDFLGQTATKAVLVKRALQLHSKGQSVPGFDHPLYPGGDPRASQLLDIARSRQSQSRPARAVFGFIDEMRASIGLHPRQELAVVVLARAMGLPRQVPAALFALGRLAGWIAHIQEQRLAGSLLRPRAKFVHAESLQSN